MEIVYTYLKLFLAVALIWPRGYLLIYLIDRTKSFSFPLKFFAGWLLGLGTFTADIFTSNYLGGMQLFWWVYASSLISQIFGFGFMILIFERRVPYPKIKAFKPFLARQQAVWKNFKKDEKLVLGVLALLIFAGLIRTVGLAGSPADLWNQKAGLIFSQQQIPLAAADPYYGLTVGHYPLHDAAFKAYLAAFISDYHPAVIVFVAVWYYLFLLAAFYFALSRRYRRRQRLLATCFLAYLLLYLYQGGVIFEDLLFAAWIILSFNAMLKYLAGEGLSNYYFSGISLALSVWAKNEAVYFAFPLLLATTLILYGLKRVKLKDFLLAWFFSCLTLGGWFIYLVFNAPIFYPPAWQLFAGGLSWPRIIIYLTPIFLTFIISDILVKLKHEKNRQ